MDVDTQPTPAGQRGPEVVLNLTADDRTILQALPPAEGRQWMLDRVVYHREYARMLSSMYNATAPIHRHLPPELLMEIFGRLEPEELQELKYLHVCRMWRELILRTAEFWVGMLRNPIRFPNGNTPGVQSYSESAWYQCFKLSLERSAPRDIFLTSQGFSELAYTSLLPHAQRIASLSVELYPQDASRLFGLLRLGMPRLRTLVVSHLPGELTSMDELGGGTLPLLPQSRSSEAANLPSLHVLSIPSVLLTSISGGSLQSLTVGCAACKLCSEARRPSVDDLLSFLRQYPFLTSLHFLKTSEPDSNRRLTESGPVSLMQLHELTFEDTSSSWASDIMRRLTLPSNAIVKFRNRNKPLIPEKFRDLPAVHASDRLALEFRKEEDMHHGATIAVCEADASVGDTSYVNVQVAVRESPGRHDTVGSVASTFASPSVRHLRVWIPTSSFRIDRTRTIRLLASFPSITRLTWKRQVPNDLFQALTSLTSAGGPICAGLEHLVVHWRLGSRTDETIFRGTCTLILSTLAHRASLGSRVRRFVFKCEGMKRMGPRFDAEREKDRLVQTFSTLAVEVVVGLKLDTTD
ncbi:hypothetical protein K466DRAFT_538685 [Polyporus arcularius HHB13444]|uniref:F-box domain-containing protein n=1 Tax=Polyporus arcularius HHB13444 TaxID=1314778 RepID=A0A5C3PW72_9APHY|nr:hypothetical protein K466DRAFT_538685 [Polyporus arcularius HHB13444]